MGIPQIGLIVLLAISWLLAARDHGKPKEGVDNFAVTVISTIIFLGLLIWGGFFK